MKRTLLGYLPAFLMATELPNDFVEVRMDEVEDKRRMPVTKLWEYKNGVVTEVTDKESRLNHLILLESGDYAIARNWINARRKFENKAKACTK